MFTKVGQSFKTQRRNIAKSAVLDEQEFQAEVGIPDSDLLARLYHKESQLSQTMARANGLSDEEAVYTRSDRHTASQKSAKSHHSSVGSVRRVVDHTLTGRTRSQLRFAKPLMP